MIQVTIDRSQIKAVRGALYGIRNGFPRVLTRAVNKTLLGVRTDATQEIYNLLNLTKKRIRKDFSITKMTWSSPVARIASTGKPVSLTTFAGTRHVKTGVSVKIKRTGARKVIRHAFVEEVKGAKQAFRREYRGTRAPFRPGFAYARMPRTYRYPIHRLTGPRIQDIYDDPAVMGKVMEKTDKRLSTHLDREVAYELRKY